jgi:hypothetical protein
MAERELPGYPLQRGYVRPYGFDGHVREVGSGTNLLRTDRLAQPQALKPGDILATGEEILSEPRGGYNGRILIHLSGGRDGTWIDVAARLPLALLTPEDNAPVALWESHVKDREKYNP